MAQIMDAAVAKQFERLPPHSIESEMCMLASMMLDVTKDAVGQILQIVDEESFFQADHTILFKVLKQLYEQNRPIDAMIVREELIKRHLLDEIGGIEYLMQIMNCVPNAANGSHYAGIVREKALLRQLIAASSEILREAYSPHEKAETVLENAEKKIFQIAERKVSGQMVAMEDVLHEVFEMIESRGQRGVETGFFELDDMLNGLQKGEMIIVAARPSMGKCLAADSEILLADGSVATIRQIHERRDANLLTLNDSLRIQPAQASDFIDDGIKPAFRVTTRLGRTVTSTLPHPYLTVDGWRKLEDLKPGDHIAVPRKIDVFGQTAVPDCQAKLLGYFIGDGGLTDSTPEFTNSNADIQSDFLAALQDFGGVSASASDSNGTRTTSFAVRSDVDFVHNARQDFSSRLTTTLQSTGRTARSVAQSLHVSPSLVWQWMHGKSVPDEQTLVELGRCVGANVAELMPAGADAGRRSSKNPITRWLESLGLWNKSSHDKFVPAVVFQSPRRSIALFLNRLFACDGWASVLASGQPQLGYATVSEKLARQVQHLLLRFGVIASLRRKKTTCNGKPFQSWQLNITDADSIETFISEIGVYSKHDALARVRLALKSRRRQTNRDLIPKSIWKHIETAKGEMSWSAWRTLWACRERNRASRRPPRALKAEVVFDRRCAE